MIDNYKIKAVCNKCTYWTGKGNKRYKCYTNKCPAKARDK